MIKIFLDTNIIIDVMEKREPYFLQSANLLELGYKGYVSLYATSLRLSTPSISAENQSVKKQLSKK